MNETVNLSEMLGHVGRNDIAGGYYKGSYSRSDTKHTERERVLNFILRESESFPEGIPVKLLSFPGIGWQFETLLCLERKNSQLVGLERSKTVYMRSRSAIPGLYGESNIYRQLAERSLHYGDGNSILYSRTRTPTFSMWDEAERSNRLLLMDAETYMSVLLTDYGATLQQKKDFNSRFYRRNAVWLDYTSQICSGVENTVRNLLFCLEPPSIAYAKPVVITVLNGRDSFHGEDARISRICDLQPALTYRDHWTYQNNGVQMLTMCFIAKEKS